MRYRKHENEAMDRAFDGGVQYSHIRLGGHWLFCRKGFAWHVIDAERIVRAWRRVEEVTSRVACCSNDFSIHRLIVTGEDGAPQSLLIGEGLYRHEPELLLEDLHARWPHIAIGKPDGSKGS